MSIFALFSGKLQILHKIDIVSFPILQDEFRELQFLWKSLIKAE